MAQVSLQGITRQYGNVTAIKDITFDIPDREFWVLVGPSGCGKSTILRTIAGLESISSGNLYIGDRLVNNVPARQRDVAMVFQNYALYPHMSVAENLAFGLKMRGEDKSGIARRVQEVARSLDIEHLLKRKPKQLSGGQQQRVFLARALAKDAELLIFDEPFTAIDRKTEDFIFDIFQELRAAGKTLLVINHDLGDSLAIYDQLLLLNKRLIAQGTRHEVVTSDNLERANGRGLTRVFA